MSTGTMVSLEEYMETSYEPDCDFVDGCLEERNLGTWGHGRLQYKIGGYFLTHYEPQGIRTATDVRIRVTPSRVRIPDLCVYLTDPEEEVPSTPPFLCIEILSPEDRMSRVEVRINDFLKMGVNTVWVIDPETRQAYTANAAEGLREVKTGVLRTESPVIEMPLAEVF
ncbi:MAG: Uma2 family endonuclease [Bryobacterales bacterium]|nr:Uma2 family endonuclease [Bryobacterales bacterium]